MGVKVTDHSALTPYMAELTSMVDKFLDTAGQKGTGKWTAVSALDTGIPLTPIGEAVFSRTLSALKDERVVAAGLLGSPIPAYIWDKAAPIADLQEALFASKLVSYTLGYMLMRAASEEFGWDLAYSNIALMWRGGCIIRAAFLDDIKQHLTRSPI